MPKAATVERARRDAREGKSPTTQAGEFVREEMHHIREGKHGARNAQQAIAIGLSKARRAGVRLAPPAKGKTSAGTRRKAKQDLQKGKNGRRSEPNRARADATLETLRKEARQAASPRALSQQTRQAAHRRGTTSRSQAASHAPT